MYIAESLSCFGMFDRFGRPRHHALKERVKQVAKLRIVVSVGYAGEPEPYDRLRTNYQQGEDFDDTIEEISHFLSKNVIDLLNEIEGDDE